MARTAADAASYRSGGGRAAAHEAPLDPQERLLCETHLRLAFARVRAFEDAYGLPSSVERGDIEGAALLALTRAVRGFRPGRAAFSTYAWVAIGRELARLCFAGRSAGAPTVVSMDAPLPGSADGEGWDDLLADDRAVDPCEEVCRSDAGRRVRSALAEMGVRSRRVLEDYYLLGLTPQEIARREGTSAHHVTRALQTASRRLRLELAARGFAD